MKRPYSAINLPENNDIESARKTRVLWLIKGMGVGGAENLLATSIPYLDRNTFDYQLAYFLTKRNDLVSRFEEADIKVNCLNINNAYDFRAVLRLVSFLKRQKIDILHIHSPHTGILGRIAAHFSRVKAVIYTEHMPLERQNRLARLGNLVTYPLNDATIAVSDAVLSSVLKRQMIKHGQYMTIYNGVDLETFNIPKVSVEAFKTNLGITTNDKVVGNVGNLLAGKGHRYLLEAARLVLNDFSGVSFVIVGKEESQESLNRLLQLAERLKIREKVIFTGFRQDVAQLMATFDVFVLPSLWEGFGIVLLEAMAMGKPVIGTKVGGIPEIIEDGANGFLVEPRNPRQLAEKILALLCDESMRDRMGQNGRQIVHERFSIQRTVRATEQVYISALNGINSRRRQASQTSNIGQPININYKSDD